MRKPHSCYRGPRVSPAPFPIPEQCAIGRLEKTAPRSSPASPPSRSGPRSTRPSARSSGFLVRAPRSRGWPPHRGNPARRPAWLRRLPQQGRRQHGRPRPTRRRQRTTPRRTWHPRGRASARSILFLVADIVRHDDSDLTAFHERHLAEGKHKMVVRVTLARKLLVRLNAIARETRLALASFT